MRTLLRKITHATLHVIATGLLLVGGVGCTLSEQVTVEILYAPQLWLKIPAQNHLNSARVFIFNSDNILTGDTTLTKTELGNPNGVRITAQVGDGIYKCISFFNIENCIASPMVIGRSTIDDLKITVDTTKKSGTASAPPISDGQRSDNIELSIAPIVITPTPVVDRLYHSIGQFVLKRGEPTVNDSIPMPAFYDIRCRITGLDRPTQGHGKVSLMLLDVPTSVNYALNAAATDRIDLTPAPVGEPSSEGSDLFSECSTIRFRSTDNVRLRILEDNVSIQTLSLEPEKYLRADAPQQLDITVEFYANFYTIIVNDWIVGSYEIISAGS